MRKTKEYNKLFEDIRKMRLERNIIISRVKELDDHLALAEDLLYDLKKLEDMSPEAILKNKIILQAIENEGQAVDKV